jgi:DNA polymerase (family 10)
MSHMNIMQLTQTIRLLPPDAPVPARTRLQPTLPGLEQEAPVRPPVTNREIAEVLANIAEILELQTANPYRIMAYRHAARGVLELAEPAATILARGENLPVAGLGQRLRERITELVTTGSMTFYNDLCVQALPRGVRALLPIRHVGIQTAVRLYQELHIDTPEKLWNAACQQHIRSLRGFGPRSEARLKLATRQFLDRSASSSVGGAA